MATLRTTRSATCLLIGLLLAPAAHGQVVSGRTLTGDWVRVDSNNDPNDLMRISIGGTAAVLTSVPAPAAPYWKVGDVLWRAIQGSGKLEVRGSDGNYYDADMTMIGPDEIHLTIHLRTAGDDQQWRRAGPDINGDWVRVAPPGTPGDGTRIQVQGVGATVRYLPATAPQSLRVGSRIWQTIGASGGLQVLGSDGQHHPATWALVAPDRVQIDAPSIAGGAGQIWVRPGSVASAGAALQPPVANPNQPTPRPLTPPPAFPPPPSAPPVPPSAPVACMATSLRHDQTDLQWQWELSSPTDDPPGAETLGIRDHLLASYQDMRGNGILTDVERSLIPGFGDGFAYIWQPRPANLTWDQWEEKRDLVGWQYDQESQTYDRIGFRPIDIEAYETPGGPRYAGVWQANSEGVDWWVDHEMTSTEYGDAFQNLRDDGYRLVDMEAYPTSNGLRYAAIWYRSCDNANWRQRRDMDRTEYQQFVDDWGAQGFRVVDFESYETSSGQRYAAIWEQVPASREWAVRTNRDLGGFLNLHRQYVDEGFRLIDYESYETSNGIRYGGVWGENDRRYDFALKPLLDNLIEGYRTTHGIPGISVVVMRDDEVIYRRGFGWADVGNRKAAHSGTVYLTASVAKVIGATIAARLEGRIATFDLASPTSDYLDDLPNRHTHTVEELLAKVGCVPHYPEGSEPDETQFYTWRLDALEQIWDDPLLSGCTPSNPGQQYHYSTHGFTYVGAVLEAVTRDPIDEIIADQLTRPFDLPSMRTVTSGTFGGFGSLGVRPYHLARGYSWTAANGSRPANYENTSWKVLGGGLQTNARDLARFGRLTSEGAIASTTRLWTPITDGSTVNWDPTDTNAVPTVGLAWVLGTANGGRRIAQHGGVSASGFGGARSHLRIYRDDGIVIAILTNQRETQANIPPNIQPGDSQPIRGLSTSIAGVVFSNLPPP